MKEPLKKVTVEKLLSLLIDLKKTNICIRVRLLGEMWERSFMRVARINGRVIMLTEENSGKSLLLSDVSTIAQFELDSRFQEFQPNFHYDVQILK
jgi:hypothetical protein